MVFGLGRAGEQIPRLSPPRAENSLNSWFILRIPQIIYSGDDSPCPTPNYAAFPSGCGWGDANNQDPRMLQPGTAGSARDVPGLSLAGLWTAVKFTLKSHSYNSLYLNKYRGWRSEHALKTGEGEEGICSWWKASRHSQRAGIPVLEPGYKNVTLRAKSPLRLPAKGQLITLIIMKIAFTYSFNQNFKILSIFYKGN